MTGSFRAGVFMTARWIRRGLGPWWLLAAAAAAVALSLSAGSDGPARRAAWTDLVELLAPVFAIGVGAYALRCLRGTGRASPFEAAPVQPFACLLGQASTLAAFSLVAVVLLVLPGALVHGGVFMESQAPPAFDVEGESRTLRGESWALAGSGRLRWRLPPLSGGWTLSSQVRFVLYGKGYPDELPEVKWSVTSGGKTLAQHTVRLEPETTLRLPLPPLPDGGEVRAGSVTEGMALTASTEGAVLTGSGEASRALTWLKMGAAIAARALFLMIVAFAASLLVSSPLAVMTAGTAWLIGWAAPFLAEFARYSGLPSIFEAHAGAGPHAAAEPNGHWLAALFGLVPDLRGGRVTGDLLEGRAPSWARVATEVGAPLGVAIGLALAAGILGLLLWRRRAGAVPGERGLS